MNQKTKPTITTIISKVNLIEPELITLHYPDGKENRRNRRKQQRKNK